MQQRDLVILGRIVGLYGVKGWLRVHSYTQPLQNILKYQPWQIQSGESWQSCRLETGKLQGKGLVIKLAEVDDRDAAAVFLQRDIAVARTQLPKLEPETFYWTDLEGLRVMTKAGQELGRLDHLFETGANDVMVVKGERERLIPWIRDQVVLQVNLDDGFIEVDWDVHF
jgi:16S rRNA processing protein RimM